MPTDESYDVYVRSGEADEKFREFVKSLGDAIEINWRDTLEV